MLSKQEHITYWVRTAEDDWGVVTTLFDAQKYVQCLFFAHLVLEKWCKAHWVKDNVGNIPPKIHNLLMLRTRMITMGTRMTRTTRTWADFSVAFCWGQKRERFNITKAFKSNGAIASHTVIKKIRDHPSNPRHPRSN